MLESNAARLRWGILATGSIARTFAKAVPSSQNGLLQAVASRSAAASLFSRSSFAPIAETVPGFDVSSWFALFAPAKTPQAIIDKIQADTKAGLADPALRTKMDQLAAEPVGGTPAELAAFLQGEMTKWGGLIKEIGIKVE